MTVVTLHVPGMNSRAGIRVVTARLRDLPGVDTVEADGRTAILVVRGAMSERAVRNALADVGFPAGPDR